MSAVVLAVVGWLVWFVVVVLVESHIYADWLGWTFFIGWTVGWMAAVVGVMLWLAYR